MGVEERPGTGQAVNRRESEIFRDETFAFLSFHGSSPETVTLHRRFE